MSLECVVTVKWISLLSTHACATTINLIPFNSHDCFGVPFETPCILVMGAQRLLTQQIFCGVLLVVRIFCKVIDVFANSSECSCREANVNVFDHVRVPRSVILEHDTLPFFFLTLTQSTLYASSLQILTCVMLNGMCII